MVDVYHVDFDHPLRRLKEYLEVVQPALKTGAVHFNGEYLPGRLLLPPRPRHPGPISALRAPAFRLAGRLADGAMSWNCPTAYMQNVACPPSRKGPTAPAATVPG